MTKIFPHRDGSMMELSTVHSTPNSQGIHSYPHLLVHYGELALKGRNRHLFEDRLVQNISRRFDSADLRAIRRLRGRIWIDFADTTSWDRLAVVAKNTFGVANAHGMWRCEPTISAIEALALDCAQASTFRTFAIRCRRADKQFPQTSQEVCVQIGRAIEMQTGARVDLDSPEWTVWIEILDHHAFVGAHRVEGPGGLPVGVSGKVVGLLSGGIDSPVAAWRMMRRGCAVVFVHFHSAPFTSAGSQEKVTELVRLLAQWQGPSRLASVPFGMIQQQIVTSTPSASRVIVYRRLMMRIAEALARMEQCEALVTGDALGQVASQTLSNLTTIEAVTELPILRPLVGMDKQEVVDAARVIGTYETSIEPHHDCCSYLEPSNPATRSTTDLLDRVEVQLDIPTLVAQGVAATRWRDIMLR